MQKKREKEQKNSKKLENFNWSIRYLFLSFALFFLFSFLFHSFHIFSSIIPSLSSYNLNFSRVVLSPIMSRLKDLPRARIPAISTGRHALTIRCFSMSAMGGRSRWGAWPLTSRHRQTLEKKGVERRQATRSLNISIFHFNKRQQNCIFFLFFYIF